MKQTSSLIYSRDAPIPIPILDLELVEFVGIGIGASLLGILQ